MGNSDMTNRILEKGLKEAGLKPGMRILDIGCGDGEAVAYLTHELGMKAEGIDTNVARIAEAREKHPGIEVKYADGEFLEDYMSYTFDGVLISNCLSLINMPDESLHEIYCVLKKGGKLILIDLYEPDPNEDQVRAVKMEADRLGRIPHKEGDCEDLGQKFVDFRFKGAFFKEPLIRQLEEIGYSIVAFEDITDMVPALEEVEKEMLDVIGEGPDDRKLGSFLMIAAKPL